MGLSKRVFRDLKKNIVRWIALMLLIVVSMYVVVSMAASADTVTSGVRKFGEDSLLEDGEFSVFVPLKDSDIESFAQKGVLIYPSFCLDFVVENNSILRVFCMRSNVNVPLADRGGTPKSGNELLLEKHYADFHGIRVGDELSIGDIVFVVCGIGAAPDYDNVTNNITDIGSDPQNFGVAFVSDEYYAKLKRSETLMQAETYLYSYRLTEDCTLTHKDLKNALNELEFDANLIEDTFIKEQIEKAETEKNDILEAIDKLKDGSRELTDAIGELKSGAKDLHNGAGDLSSGVKAFEDEFAKLAEGAAYYTQGSETAMEAVSALQTALADIFEGSVVLKDGSHELYGGTSELKEGADKLCDGVDELSERADSIVSRLFDGDYGIENLTMFLEASKNPRIAASADDVNINKVGGIVGGIILMILVGYVIAVFVIHKINEDSIVIGTLYSMGVSRNTILRHYIILPVIITLCGGAIGLMLGLSEYGAGSMMKDHAAVYSFPELNVVYPLYLIIYSIVLPPVITAIVVSLIIRKRLERTPLSLLRRTANDARMKNINISEKRGFINAFRIRQILREKRSSLTLFGGMFVAMLVLVLGIICMVAINSMERENAADIRYENLYMLKYMPESIPADAEAAYTQTLKKEALGYDLDVTLMGIQKGSRYFAFDLPDEKNSIIVGSSTAIKYGLHEGDIVVFEDELNDRLYSFKIAGIEQYSVGLHVFMDIDNMRELFGREQDYYNALLSDKELEIDNAFVFNVITKKNLIRFAGIFRNSMGGMVSLLLGSAVIVFIVVMYLMIKVMIDRAAFHISLVKVFGFTNREVKKMYLDGNFLTVLLSGMISVPLAKLIMNKCWLLLCSNIAGGFNTLIPWYMYAALFGLIIGCYLIVSWLMMLKLNRISPADVLKDRE